MERIAMIRRESRRCGDITRRLLDFSHGDKAGRVPTDIAELIREVLLMVQHLGRYADRIVSFDCDRSIVAEVNAAQLKQVILNLIANGLQATVQGPCDRAAEELVDSIVLPLRMTAMEWTKTLCITFLIRSLPPKKQGRAPGWG